MPISLETAAVNLALALLLGAIVGSERQVRQRMAGLRTNALVALGAASFVVFSALYPDEVSPTRVGAQVVTGIGFLGAGIIFRHGFTIHGLNTAATLWCSAALGMMAGAGALTFAALLTGLIVFVNLGLRPLVKWLKKVTKAGMPIKLEYRVNVTCQLIDEGDVRSLLLRCFSVPGLQVTSIEKHVSEATDTVELETFVSGDDADDLTIEQAVGALLVNPVVAKVSWESSTDS